MTQNKNQAGKYDWLFDITRKSRKVRSFLKNENVATDVALAPLKPLQDQLVSEMATRERTDRTSAPIADRHGVWEYFTEFDAEASQERHLRRHIATGMTQVLLDEDIESDGGYYDLGALEISDDNNLMAFTFDRDGSEKYTLVVRDLRTGEDLIEMDGITPSVVFNTTGDKVAYVITDESERPNEVRVLDIKSGRTRRLYRQDNERYHVDIDHTSDLAWLKIVSEGTDVNETVIVPRDTFAKPQRFTKAIAGTKYYVDSVHGQFYALSSHESLDNGIYSAEPAQPRTEWETLVAPQDGVFFTDFQVFESYVVFDARINGFPRVGVASRAGNTVAPISWIGDITDASAAEIEGNENPSATTVRITYDTWTDPRTIRVFDMSLAVDGNPIALEAGTIIHQEVVVGYNPDLYTSKVIWATSHDGVRVPASVIYRKDADIIGSMMWAYGAYGATEDPMFVGSWISYLDRGVAVVDAHVRGGSEMGRAWYEQGRLANKKNTFHDVIAIAEELGRQGFTPNGNLVLQGGSAGGLLVGATINMAPQLFSGAVAQVPFVDVLTTMSNPDLPLTKYEYQEWGNPSDDAEARALIASYSPVDNVTAQAYPPIMATTGLNDPRVGYWEPAKWVLTLREHSTSGAPVYLRTNMSAGHGGETGRLESFEEAAITMSFVLSCLGVTAPAEGVISERRNEVLAA